MQAQQDKEQKRDVDNQAGRGAGDVGGAGVELNRGRVARWGAGWRSGHDPAAIPADG